MYPLTVLDSSAYSADMTKQYAHTHSDSFTNPKSSRPARQFRIFITGGRVHVVGEVPPTITIEEAAELCGIGRSHAYKEAARYRRSNGKYGLPNIEFHGRYVCPTLPILRLLGFTPDPPHQGHSGVARAA